MSFLAAAIGHDAKLEVDYAPGGHPGWDEYWFTFMNHRFRLLTVNREDEKVSHIIFDGHPQERSFDQFWPSYQTVVLPCILTPEAAFEILGHLFDKWQAGTVIGRKNKAEELRKALFE
ncbi:hypothetical protein vBCbaSRXM_33 [Citromicrobium phage vB_CbaS-RXM]|nr:hypothetical protein vBCbaSRXM_33 [Citromicrobium phage vB_CbaS-RXM]